MMDESILTSQFVGKDVVELREYTDSLQLEIDSIARINTAATLSTYVRRVAESDFTPTVRTELPYASTKQQESYIAEDKEVSEVALPRPVKIDRKPINHYKHYSEEQEEYNLLP